jgi:amino acid transporter
MTTDRVTRDNSADVSTASSGRLGTFAGVFTPSILTILGIILFLRLGYVTGSAGLGRTLLILLVANLVTIITSQSLAAVATNLKVKGGGDYYLISRTLGYKFGGSIGIVLYLAQSVSVAFYCIGFAEALTTVIGTAINPGIFAAIAIGALFILAWLGADWAVKFQYLVMLLLVAALVSFYVGGLEKWQQSVFIANWGAPGNAPPFWIIFAIFFPAVTGFTQGVSMSGDLKDPGRSLPLGTFLAVGFSIVVYLSVIVIFAGVLSNQELAKDYQAMQRVARYGFLIDAGVIAATLSSAMASFMGGPRILQSLAADKIFPILSPFAKGAGDTNNPRRGIMLTGTIALVTISLGQLNLVAQIVSMFFLISYGLLNYATYFEADTGSTSFRPRFRFFNKYLSLAGGLLCLGILLALDMKNGVAALALMFVIYLYLKHSAKPARWADSSRSHAYSHVRRNLQQMTTVAEHQRDWHPHILAFTNHQETRGKLLIFGDWICGKIGLMTAVQILSSSGVVCRKVKSAALEELQKDIKSNNLFCYPKVICSEDFPATLSVLLQSQGFGPLHGNTILTNWYNKPNAHLPGLEVLKYGHNMMTAYRQGYNLVIFHCDASKWQSVTKVDGKRDRIDIWWQSEQNSSRLMLLLAYLTTRNSIWNKAEIRVLTAGSGESLGWAKNNLMELLDEARIPAEPHLVKDMESQTVIEHSKDSSLVFLPFRIQQSRLTDIHGYSLERILPQLPPAALVMAAEEIDLDAEPEEGTAGEMAKAMDDLYAAEKRLRRARREEVKANEGVEKLSDRLRSEAEDQEGEGISEKIAELQNALFEAEENREKLYRKTAKAQVRNDDAVHRVQELGGTLDNEQEES